MTDALPQPHDHLFRTVFSEPEEAVALLRAYLPPTVGRTLKWSTLTVQDGRFVDERLRGSESDLLYAIEREAGDAAWLYVLLEHQSTADRRMRVRLLTYCCRIWDRGRQQHPTERELRPILPLVFFQGAGRWGHATEFAAEVRQWPWVPRFEHLLIDQTVMAPDAVRGEVRGRIAQLLMMAAYRESWHVLQHVVPLLAALRPVGEIDHLLPFVAYVQATQRGDIWRRFAEAVRRSVPAGGTVMNTPSNWCSRDAGRDAGEGRLEGQVGTIENLLRAGVQWPIIESATGIDPDALRALKRRLGGADKETGDTD